MPTGYITAHPTSENVGRMMIIAPQNPMAMADSRLIPMRSRRITTDNSVTSIGSIKKMDIASAIGRYISPVKNKTVAAAISAPRMACRYKVAVSQGSLVRKTNGVIRIN